MAHKNNSEKLTKLQKYEPLIAGIALFIGLALLAAYIILFVMKTNRDAEKFINKTSSAFYENTSIEEFFDFEPLDVSVLPSGEMIVKSVTLFEGVNLTADSKGVTVLVDDDGKLIPSAVFVTDSGERITAYSSDNGVSFITDSSNTSEFTLNEHTFSISASGGVTVDGYTLIADSTAVPMTTTGEQTTVPDTLTTTGEDATGSGQTGTGEVTGYTQSSVGTEGTGGTVGTSSTEQTTVTTTVPKPQTTPTTTVTTKKPTPTTTTTTKKPTPTTTTTTTVTTTKKKTTVTTYHTNDELIAEVLRLVNEERKKAGVSPVSGLIALDKAAQIRAQEITGDDSNFSHTRPNGKAWYTVLDENHISYSAAGENLAAGQSTAEMVVSDWMSSSGHRANILDPNFKYMGVGYVEYDGYLYWSQLFLK